MHSRVELRRMGTLAATSAALRSGAARERSAPTEASTNETLDVVAAALDSLTSATLDYMHTLIRDDHQMWSDLHTETQALGPIGVMQITRDQSQLLTMLVRLAGARTAVEVGTFTGASAIAIARGLPADGHVISCDIDEQWTAIARKHWRLANVAERIDLRLGPAIETLRALPLDSRIDFAFIDADKGGYIAYYEEILKRMGQGGVVVLDNVFLEGAVFDPTNNAPLVRAMRAVNEHVCNDPRVDTALLTVADGLLVARVR